MSRMDVPLVKVNIVMFGRVLVVLHLVLLRAVVIQLPLMLVEILRLLFHVKIMVRNVGHKVPGRYYYYSKCTITECTTQAERDSVNCVLNPSLPECIVTTDTTLFACSDNASGNGALYRLSCKATNGQVTSCNGKTDVDVVADGTLVRQMTGTCAQNGFETGIVGGASSDSASAPPSANADCFAITGATCHMRDKVSGNTFRCACDGSCDVALRNLMAGEASCSNPYVQPNDTIHIGSSASTPSSSGGGSPSSSEGSTEPTSSEGAVHRAVQAFMTLGLRCWRI